ncbi:MAG: hypothetical protein ABSG49_04310 [Methanoregula sp.]|jgi:hypothetical protein|uniref:hypothetical protein n=1 Tax=Methanoregula sp. TaxID=2052170 RepID=UPI003C1D2434
MSGTQFFPISPELFAHACDTVSKRVSQLPFLRGGVHVTGELVGVTMECLNAEVTRALAVSTPRDVPESVAPGLDVCLEQRMGIPGKTTVPVITEVLCSAGITEMTEIIDRQLHRHRKAVRLLAPWTWHIASTLAPSVRLGGAGTDGASSLSWMDMCPICRTGILERVVGKQLFGIPHTDFYIECTHCGAKFIPVGPAFRLVSIATIRDPLWKKHLDKTYPPETWAALARGTGNSNLKESRQAEKKPAGQALPAASVMLTPLKDGSLAVPLLGKTLYFRPIGLKFSGGVRDDAFSRIQKTLADVLAEPVFAHLKEPVNARYSRYLPMQTGLFLSQLKERFDPFYREFLNPYGDEKYGTFRAENSGDMEKKGVLIVVVNRGLYHAAESPGPVSAAINNRFGRIGAEDCLITGDPVRCRVNALLCNNRKEAGLYFHSADQEDERLSLLHAIEHLMHPGES